MTSSVNLYMTNPLWSTSLFQNIKLVNLVISDIRLSFYITFICSGWMKQHSLAEHRLWKKICWFYLMHYRSCQGTFINMLTSWPILLQQQWNGWNFHFISRYWVAQTQRAAAGSASVVVRSLNGNFVRKNFQFRFLIWKADRTPSPERRSAPGPATACICRFACAHPASSCNLL